MKNIEFDFLPITINKKYSKAIQELPNNSNIILFDKYEGTIKLYKNWFDKVCVYISFDDFKIQDEITNELTSRFGNPELFSFATLRVWNIDDLYVSFGELETNYNVSELVLKISLIKPFNLMKYDYFLNIKNILSNIAYNWNLNFVCKPSVLFDKTILCIYENKNYQYTISIKKNKIEMFSHEKVLVDAGTKLVPSWKEKNKINIENLELIITSFFTYMQEYDQSLTQRVD